MKRINTIKGSNLSIIATLILLIFITQSRFFDFFINDYLGRLLFLIVVIIISSLNQISGLIILLVFILMFNYSKNNIVSYNSFQVFENFENIDSNTFRKSITTKDNKKLNHEKLLSSVISNTNNNNTDTTNDITTDTTNTTSTETFKQSREGFCLTDKETSILRGKQSNQINVSREEQNTDFITPNEPKNLFSYFS
jgi:hypothetical protein